MGDNRNFAVLDWVQGEIVETLQEARQSLEAYVEDPKDETKIRFCLTHIHQVYGSLQIVEFEGASLLAKEMELLTQALISNSVVHVEDAQEILMRTMLQLPVYLTQIRTTKEDNPRNLIPLINDIRAVTKRPLMSEEAIFDPDLSRLAEKQGKPHDVLINPEKRAEILKKLREMYQFAAASLLRGVKVQENLEYIDKVFTRLEVLTRTTPVHATWLAASAIIESIKADDLELSYAVKSLLRYLARELRVLSEKAPASFNALPNEKLIKNLFYYVARSEGDTVKLKNLRKRFLLHGALHGSQAANDDAVSSSTPNLNHDSSAISSVVVALLDELTSIKGVIDYAIGGQGTTADIKDMLPSAKRVADTLAVLGIGELRQQMLEQNAILEEIAATESIDEQKLIKAAGKLIEVEQRLEAVSKAARTGADIENIDEREVEIDDAKLAVINECRIGLEQSKEAIVEYISSQWDKSYLNDVGTLLNNIRGGLHIIPLLRPAAIIDSCAAFIREQLFDKDAHPEWATLETLADAIASVEYYLEHLSGDLKGDSEAILKVAEESVEALGYQTEYQHNTAGDVVKSGAQEPQQPELETNLSVDNQDSDVSVPVAIADEQADAAAVTVSRSNTDSEAPTRIDTPLAQEPLEKIGEQHTEEAPETPHSEETVEASFDAAENVTPTVANLSSHPSASDDIDDEIIEIFIEEAGEVRETLAEFYPIWKQDNNHQEAMTTVRRAFHTLKGSGRMVGANVIGELAWSIENMLNRVLDKSVSLQDAHFFIIDNVILLIPDLISEFNHGKQGQIKTTQVKVDEYSDWAHALSSGEINPALAEAMTLSNTPSIDNTANVEAAGFEIEEAVVEVENEEDVALREIFSSEAHGHLDTIRIFIEKMDDIAPIYTPPSDALQRALHTLKGSAKMAKIGAIAEMSEPLELFTKELISYQVNITPDILQLVRDIVSYTEIGLSQLERGQTIAIPRVEQFVARTHELRELAVGHLIRLREQNETGEYPVVDPELLSIFMAEEMNLLLDSDKFHREWQENGQVPAQFDAMTTELDTLAKGAMHANLPELQRLSELLAKAQRLSGENRILADNAFFESITAGHIGLLDMVDAVAAGQHVVAPAAQVYDQLQALISSASDASDVSNADEVADIAEGDPVETTPAASSLNDVDQGTPSSDSEGTDTAGLPDNVISFPNALQPEENLPITDLSTESQTLSDSDEGSEASQIEGSPLETSSLEGFDAEANNSALDNAEAENADENISEYFEQVNEQLPDAFKDYIEPSIEVEGEDSAQLESQNAIESSGEGDVAGLAVVDEPLAEAVEENEAFNTEEPLSDVQLASTEESAQVGTAPFSEDDDAFDLAVDENDQASGSNVEEISAAEGELSLDSQGDTDIDSGDFVEQIDVSEPFEENTLADQDGSEREIEDLNDVTESDISALSPVDELPVDSETAIDPAAEEVLLSVDPESTAADDEFESQGEYDAAADEVATSDAFDLSQESELADEDVADVTAEIEAVADESSVDSSVYTSEPEVASIPGLLDDIDSADPNYDQDILEVFLEEADELAEELDGAVDLWENDWSDRGPVEEIKRALHTYKGGARLAGLTNLGELTHEYESFLIMTRPDQIDQAFFEKVHAYQDQLHAGIRAVKQFLDSGMAAATGSGLQDSDVTKVPEVADGFQMLAVDPNQDSNSEPEVQPSLDAQQPMGSDNEPESNVVTLKPAADADGDFTLPIREQSKAPAEFAMPGAAQAPAPKKAGPQEVVRIGAELLEELVNLAGETSISRSRLEQHVSDFGHSLEEMDTTISRLQEQLRRLDIETEAQVLFRQEQMAVNEEFDPLEMDRYSALQQLSRSLIESSSDLVDLREELTNKLRDTETLLVQQARINTDMQEGLMRSRMVPFSRLVPRLRRIVRQVASELGKSVSFELDNVEGELDRSVLERMVPPFEHMLRNAVDHGIETPDERIDAGKPESGRIVLTLGREGGDVIIRLADDGRGVNLQRVKQKAVERGLMTENAELSDHDIVQFILHAGFSTAENVTQISGRGVGMDVVHSEIKQLGGAMTINSEWGKGTEFVIRLPFTLSVNRALMVQIGQDMFAVPLSSIEGIVRVSPFELEHYYDNPEARFEYANENYHVRYLGGLLNLPTQPVLEGHALPLPVLLVRSAEHTMAIHVDSLLGSREIVVKSLGQQFASVTGLSGATLMGDGSVVVILDPHALVRQEIARASLPDPTQSAIQSTAALPKKDVLTVMVVDDSVTVRKVTSRFLEREGFEVITAKDGVDALRVLQEQIPDVMLLDIEMPRMDGFEVAHNIRTTSRWKHIPIIMITSRTGDKHREHAISLGVNRYMGKPYQEEVLLESINDLIESPVSVE